MTIYETYLEEVKKIPADTLEGCIAEGSRINTLIGTNDIKEILRQSFIAMVEGEIEELKKARMQWVGGEAELHIQIADGYNQCISDQISRLESELDKLQNNK